MSVALPELPDDRRAQTGRHSRGPFLPGTPWPIDGIPSAARRSGPDSREPNGHASNGHGSNGHGVNGHYANGSAEAPGVNGRVAAAPQALAPVDVRDEDDLATSPHGLRAVAARSAPYRGDDGRADDGQQGDDVARTVPNGRPPTAGPPPDPAWTDVPGEGAGRRRVRSDVPPVRRGAPPVVAPSADTSAAPPPPAAPMPGSDTAPTLRAPRTWPVRARSGVPERSAPDAEPRTVVFPVVDEDVHDRRDDDGPAGEEFDEDYGEPPANGHHVPGPDDEAADFPGRHRRRANEPPEERSVPTARDRSDGSGDTGRGERPGRGGRGSSGGGRGGRRRRSSFWKELPVLIVVALVLTFLIQTFLAKVYVIPSGSMETTLHGCTGCNNDRVLVDKVTYRFSDPQPGNVVVFRGPDGWTSEFSADQSSSVVVRALQSLGSLVGLAPPDEKDFIKRVIAVGGQTVQCCDSHNRVLVDGKPLDEPYLYFLPDAGSARQDAFGPVTVPAGDLWVMGDSRNNSADSRANGHGPVPVSDVIGRARMIVLPFGRFGTIPSPDPQAGTAIGMGADPAGAPAALGVLALLPLAVWRRRSRADDEFLPRLRT